MVKILSYVVSMTPFSLKMRKHS